jgi:hypothetical protein
MGKITHTGTGMNKILYLQAYMGNPTSIIFCNGYVYGPVAISTSIYTTPMDTTLLILYTNVSQC